MKSYTVTITYCFNTACSSPQNLTTTVQYGGSLDFGVHVYDVSNIGYFMSCQNYHLVASSCTNGWTIPLGYCNATTGRAYIRILNNNSDNNATCTAMYRVSPS